MRSKFRVSGRALEDQVNPSTLCFSKWPQNSATYRWDVVKLSCARPKLFNPYPLDKRLISSWIRAGVLTLKLRSHMREVEQNEHMKGQPRPASIKAVPGLMVKYSSSGTSEKSGRGLR